MVTGTAKAAFGRVLVFAGILIASANVVWADDLLVGEFNAETHPLIRDTPEPPSRQQIVTNLLREAQFAFSGMIYGFNFVYTPSDPVRQVKEVFDLKPIAEIPWGDPRLSVLSTRSTAGLFFAQITYRPADFQVFRLQGWRSNSNAHAAGSGGASYLLGTIGRETAVNAAIKNAIREYVRAREYNRPREIRGSLALLDPPRIGVQRGEYVADVRIALDIRAILPYTVF